MSFEDKSGPALLSVAKLAFLVATSDEDHSDYASHTSDIAENAIPVKITTDGTAKGTKLTVNGEDIPFKYLYMECTNGGEYEYCSISITLEAIDENGIIIEKTLRLRQD